MTKQKRRMCNKFYQRKLKLRYHWFYRPVFEVPLTTKSKVAIPTQHKALLTVKVALLTQQGAGALLELLYYLHNLLLHKKKKTKHCSIKINVASWICKPRLTDREIGLEDKWMEINCLFE